MIGNVTRMLHKGMERHHKFFMLFVIYPAKGLSMNISSKEEVVNNILIDFRKQC